MRKKVFYNTKNIFNLKRKTYFYQQVPPPKKKQFPPSLSGSSFGIDFIPDTRGADVPKVFHYL